MDELGKQIIEALGYSEEDLQNGNLINNPGDDSERLVPKAKALIEAKGLNAIIEQASKGHTDERLEKFLMNRAGKILNSKDGYIHPKLIVALTTQFYTTNIKDIDVFKTESKKTSKEKKSSKK